MLLDSNKKWLAEFTIAGHRSFPLVCITEVHSVAVRPNWRDSIVSQPRLYYWKVPHGIMKLTESSVIDLFWIYGNRTNGKVRIALRESCKVADVQFRVGGLERNRDVRFGKRPGCTDYGIPRIGHMVIRTIVSM
jgi:hypothetical protein